MVGGGLFCCWLGGGALVLLPVPLVPLVPVPLAPVPVPLASVGPVPPLGVVAGVVVLSGVAGT